MFGAVITGQNISIAPNYAEAKLSASRLFTLFEREPIINADSDEGLTPVSCFSLVSNRYFVTNTSFYALGPLQRRYQGKVGVFCLPHEPGISHSSSSEP